MWALDTEQYRRRLRADDYEELIQFLHISRGSAGEFRSMLHVMGRMQRFTHLEPQRQQMLKDVISISKQLKGWSDNLRSRLKT
jgi:four helix bundle protein